MFSWMGALNFQLDLNQWHWTISRLETWYIAFMSCERCGTTTHSYQFYVLKNVLYQIPYILLIYCTASKACFHSNLLIYPDQGSYHIKLVLSHIEFSFTQSLRRWCYRGCSPYKKKKVYKKRITFNHWQNRNNSHTWYRISMFVFILNLNLHLLEDINNNQELFILIQSIYVHQTNFREILFCLVMYFVTIIIWSNLKHIR